MAVISWGKPSLFETTPSVDGAPAANAQWATIETPKENTLKINVTAGSETTATEEGGGVVDVRFNANTYSMEFDEFVKKGKKSIFEDVDGVIAGEHSFRFLPEDDTCEGRLIERSTVRVEETFTTADGIIRHYVARCQKPKTGNTVKKFTKEQAAQQAAPTQKT